MKRLRYAEGTVLRAAVSIRDDIPVDSRVRVVSDSGDSIDIELLDDDGEVIAMAGMPAHMFCSGVDWVPEQ